MQQADDFIDDCSSASSKDKKRQQERSVLQQQTVSVGASGSPLRSACGHLSSACKQQRKAIFRLQPAAAELALQNVGQRQAQCVGVG